MLKANISFEPTDEIRVKKAWHIAYLTGAAVIPAAVLIITLVNGTFNAMTIPVLLIIAAVILALDYANTRSRVVWNSEKIALIQAFSKPKEYMWENLSAIYSSESEMRLEFDDGKKLYVVLAYENIEMFVEKAEQVYEAKFGGSAL
ncbi:MAG: hypothetical protein NC395_09125 [Prevotella sp.]|nr:hypothetical protein [Prevotella sp.]